MKEKTAELKEKIEKDYKDMMAVINSTSLPLFVEDTIEDMHILIETLISENKELKENRKYIADNYITDCIEYEELIKRDYISKSKVKELLKEIQEEGKIAYENFMNKKLEEDFEKDGAILQELGYIEGKLQSLLGKE